MKQLPELLKKNARIVVPVLVVIVLLMVWWFGWMAHESSDAASTDAAIASAQGQVLQLQDQIDALVAEEPKVRADLPFLKRFPKEIPPQPEQGLLIDEIQSLANATSVKLGTVDVPPAAPGTSPVTPIPISVSVSGSQAGVLAFLAGLTGSGPDAIKRLVTVQSVSLSGSGNVLAVTNTPYALELSATAYTTFAPTTPQAATTAAG